MTTGVSRRAFLSGAGHPDRRGIMRPPGADAESFAALCRDCDACLTACPQDILRPDDTGRPQLYFAAGECTFCHACIDACPTGALSDAHAPWRWRARIQPSCLAQNGITCRACQDVCDPRAIRFQLATGGRALPHLDLDACTGCGACATACPAGAVTFYEIPQTPEEAA